LVAIEANPGSHYS